jgi:hemoglobin/transferrin/lactoferrin receptor protein
VGIAENGFTQFQAINIDSVEISGIEGQINWRLSESFNSMNNWQVRASFSVQDSKNKATGEELESILPSQTVVGIQYNEIDDPWRLELAATYTRKANAISSDPDSVFFVAPSHVTWDLLGHYNVNDNIKINGGIFNLSDKEYWLASEVRGQSDTANLLPLTSVGRNASVNVIVTF